MYSACYFCPALTELAFSLKISVKPSIQSLAKICHAGRLFHADVRTDRRTDGKKQDKDKSRFVQLCEHV